MENVLREIWGIFLSIKDLLILMFLGKMRAELK